MKYAGLFKIPFYILLGCFFLYNCSRTSQNEPIAKVFVTTMDKGKLLEEKLLFSEDDINSADAIITIDTTKTFQEMDGFGYTLTGGSALHLNKMAAGSRKRLIQELFGTGKNDIGVSYLRLSIGGSDLDERPWSYNDLPDGETDVELKNFSLSYDTLYLIPVLKEIIKIAPDIKILGSPWSPPKWMKDNNDTRGGSLKPEYYEVYAKYFVKYINKMQENGILIDAITVQNEPLHPGNNPSLLMLAEQQLVFVKDHLGPAFERNNIDTKIIIYDHNADRPDYPITILNDTLAARFIDGSAFHLYNGKIESISKVHEAHPSKNLYFTEQWIGAPGNFKENMTWHTEQLIIGASRNWCKTVLEWNLAADKDQRPHTNRGGCEGCLGAVTILGDDVVRNPAYYIIAHASKFVRPGYIRVASNSDESIRNVAFKGPDGGVTVIIQNRNETQKRVRVKNNNKIALITLEAGAIASLIF